MRARLTETSTEQYKEIIQTMKEGFSGCRPNERIATALVQRLLQHSSASTTQRYIGIEPQKIEQAILNHANLL